MFINLDITFFKNQPYYAHTHLQEEDSNEASFWEIIYVSISSFKSMFSIPVQSLICFAIPSLTFSPFSSSLSKMPTQQLREEDLPQPKLHVYSKRTNPRKIKQLLVHCQEPKPISIDLEGISNSYSSLFVMILIYLLLLEKEPDLVHFI